MKILLKILLLALVCSPIKTHADCLHLANKTANDINHIHHKRAQILAPFFRSIEQLYYYQQTELTNSYTNKQNFEDLSNTNIESLSLLIKGFADKKSVELIVNFLKNYQIALKDPITTIHDGINYGGPLLCPNNHLLDPEEIAKILSNTEQYQHNLEQDIDFLRVHKWRTHFVRDSDLKIGIEIELGHSIFIDKIVSPIVDFNHLINLAKNAGKNNKLKTIHWVQRTSSALRNHLRKHAPHFKRAEAQIELSLTNKKEELEAYRNPQILGDFPALNLLVLNHLEPTMVTPELAWKMLAHNDTLNDPSVLKFLSSPMLNVILTEEQVRTIQLFDGSSQASLIELVTKNPFINMAGFLEHTFLTTRAAKNLTEEIFLPKQQTSNDFTVHFHISMQKRDLRRIGQKLNDTLALYLLLGDREENLDSLNDWVKYVPNPLENTKNLIRLAPYGEHNRLEFRRLFADWPLAESLEWLSTVLKYEEKEALTQIIDKNHKLYQQLVSKAQNNKIYGLKLKQLKDIWFEKYGGIEHMFDY